MVAARMSATFTDDEIGKLVESAAGEELGVITAIDRETAYVELEEGVADSTRAALGWEGPAGDVVALPGDSVGRITEDAVRLESELGERQAATESLDEPAGGRSGDVEYAPGEPVESSRETADVAGGPDAGTAEETGATDAQTYVDPDEMAGDGAETDAAAEIDGDEERGRTERDQRGEADPMGEIDDAGEVDPDMGTGGTQEMDAVEEAARRELEVDPTELTDDDPEIEVRPDEDVGNRTDAAVEPDDIQDRGAPGDSSTGNEASSDDEDEERDEGGR